MPPVNINSISVSKKTDVPAGNPRGLRIPGRVTSVSDGYGSNGKMVRVEVVHGKKLTPKNGKEDGNAVSPFYDNRPTSSVAIPKKHAHKFAVGHRVHVAIMPDTSSDAGDGEPDGDE